MPSDDLTSCRTNRASERLAAGRLALPSNTTRPYLLSWYLSSCCVKSRTSCCESGYRCTCSSPAVSRRGVSDGQRRQHLFLTFNSCVNFLIYCFMGRTFRQILVHMFARRNNSGSRSMRSARGCVSGRGASGRGASGRGASAFGTSLRK